MKIMKLYRLPVALLSLLFGFIFYTSTGLAQQDLLQAGPMVGYSEMSEIGLWIQTTKAAEVFVAYRPQNSKDTTWTYTPSIQTHAASAFIAKPVLTNLPHSTKFEYKVFINGQELHFDYPLTCQSQLLWQWRTDPPTFKFVFGSCTYVNEEEDDRPGKGYGSDYEIFTAIYNERPDFMIWGGDNTYLREPDWGSRSGIFHRYTHTRSLKELQPLLASVHHYATWDDHDFGPNDSDYTFWNKHITTEAFNLFWCNQHTNQLGRNDIISTFQWGDAQFFLLDNRTYRQAQNYKATKKSYLGEAQVQWLIESLVASKATFKFVVMGAQVLNESNIFENYATYPEERQRLLDKIAEQNIDGVIFLTGDRHHSVVTKMERTNTYPLFDFTSSPLTAGASQRYKDENPTAIKESFIERTHNFAVIEISGKRKNRQLKLTYKDKDGKELYTLTLSEEELNAQK